MGHYSVLTIGEEELNWKYDIPSYLSFLFKNSDFYKQSNRDKIEDSEEEEESDEYIEEIGFQTTCEKAIEKLDQLGFNWKMIVDVYSFFYDDLKENFNNEIFEEVQEKYNLDDHSKIEKKIDAYYRKFPNYSREEELRDYTNFFVPILHAMSGKKSGKAKSNNGKTYTISPDKNIYGKNIIHYEIDSFLYSKILNLPPWVLIISHLFDDELVREYSEIISVVRIKLLLESHSLDTTVQLNLADIIDSEEDIADFHNDSAFRIIEKINLYNKFFTSITNQEATLKNIYLKQKINDLLSRLDSLKVNDKYQKGKSLEDLVELIFTAVNGFEIIDKRMSNGDEEVDLVIKNNIEKTFWTALSSPCIFIECKNWSSKIGSKEIRDFETKLRNHNRLVKVGIFVSYNGFTREALTELKRSSRDEYHIATIDGNDIRDFISSKSDLVVWLEKIITKFY